ncbi:hypothetical protein EV175_003562 [Coemansia sp. RSA 1933]|nr:hypothetical protein EV175_003562 [Coemansia sp. RSA 1933]
MFAQVHAYAEHATRTRPNMNDVGRALEERSITTSQLDSYLNNESAARDDPAVASVVRQLNQQAQALDSGSGNPSSEHSSAFFNDAAESILRKLVESHVKAEEERMENERMKDQARKDASRVDSAPSAPQKPLDSDADGKSSADAQIPEQRRVRINIDSYSDHESDPGELTGNIRGGESDDDIEGEEDADFEAPAVNTTHISGTPASSDATSRHVSETIQQDVTDGGAAGSPQNQPEDKGDSRDGETKPAAKQQREHEVERVLLPSFTLPPYIPRHCPPFPSPHTYKRTPVFPEREQDFFRNRMHKAEQSRQAEENLQRLISDPRVDQNRILPSDGSHAKRRRRRSSTAESINETESVGAVNTDASQADLTPAIEPNRKNTAKHTARKVIQNLFPPANFRNVHKRTQLTGFMN